MTRGEFISEKRRQKGLTAEELAAKLKVSADTVREWEAGALPASEYILPLAEALDIPAEDILKEEKEESYYEKLNREMGYPQDPKSPNYNPEVRGSNGYFRAERIMGYVIMSLFMLYVVIFFGRELSSWLNRPRALTLENMALLLAYFVAVTFGILLIYFYYSICRWRNLWNNLEYRHAPKSREPSDIVLAWVKVVGWFFYIIGLVLALLPASIA